MHLFSFKLLQLGDECICFRFAICLHIEVANAFVFVQAIAIR
jgi:hypothetical protein